MIKYFHELSKEEFASLVSRCPSMTWQELALEYPQPRWCSYPEAVSGQMGCWSLMAHRVSNEDYCKSCDCYRRR